TGGGRRLGQLVEAARHARPTWPNRTPGHPRLRNLQRMPEVRIDGVWGRGARVIQTPKSLIGAGSKAAEAPGQGAPPRGSADGDAGLTRSRVPRGRDTRDFGAFTVDRVPAGDDHCAVRLGGDLPRHRDEWVRASLITEAQADAIQAFEDRRTPRASVTLITEALGYLGAALAAAAAAVL